MVCVRKCVHNQRLLRLKPIYLLVSIYLNGAPGGIRTPDQVVRSHLLYPAELRVQYVAV